MSRRLQQWVEACGGDGNGEFRYGWRSCVGGGWGHKRARERIRSQNTHGLWAMLVGWLHLIFLRIYADNGDENWRPNKMP